MVAKNDSANASSQHSPLRPTERTTPLARASSAKSLLVYLSRLKESSQHLSIGQSLEVRRVLRRASSSRDSCGILC